MLPAFYNSKDLKNKKTEYMLKSTSQILPGQTISSPSKSVSRQILLILLVLMIVGLVLYLGALLLFYFFLILIQEEEGSNDSASNQKVYSF